MLHFSKRQEGTTNCDPKSFINRFISVDSISNLDSFTHLIVGGSRGIGRSLVDQSIHAGQQVVALSRTDPAEQPSGCEWITGDAGKPDEFIEQLPEKISALTFCPGKVILGPIKRLKPEQMLEAYQTSVLDAFTLVQSVLPRLDGSVVFISSVAASAGLPNHCAISAAKSGLEGFALALSADLAPKVRVNVVAPTLTPTEMGLGMVGGDKMIPMIENRHPLKIIPAVDEIAATITFLHSDAAKSITGQVLKVDAGLSKLRLNDR